MRRAWDHYQRCENDPVIPPEAAPSKFSRKKPQPYTYESHDPGKTCGYDQGRGSCLSQIQPRRGAWEKIHEIRPALGFSQETGLICPRTLECGNTPSITHSRATRKVFTRAMINGGKGTRTQKCKKKHCISKR